MEPQHARAMALYFEHGTSHCLSENKKIYIMPTTFFEEAAVYPELHFKIKFIHIYICIYVYMYIYIYIYIYAYHSIVLFFSLKCVSKKYIYICTYYIYIYYIDWIQPASDSPTPPIAFITTQVPRFRVEPQRIAVKPPSLLSEGSLGHKLGYCTQS